MAYINALNARLETAMGIRSMGASAPDLAWPAPPRPAGIAELWFMFDGGARPWVIRLPLPGSPSPSPWTRFDLDENEWADLVSTWLEQQVQARCRRWAAHVDDGVVRHLEVDAGGLVVCSTHCEGR